MSSFFCSPLDFNVAPLHRYFLRPIDNGQRKLKIITTQTNPLDIVSGASTKKRNFHKSFITALVASQHKNKKQQHGLSFIHYSPLKMKQFRWLFIDSAYSLSSSFFGCPREWINDVKGNLSRVVYQINVSSREREREMVLRMFPGLNHWLLLTGETKPVYVTQLAVPGPKDVKPSLEGREKKALSKIWNWEDNRRVFFSKAITIFADNDLSMRFVVRAHSEWVGWKRTRQGRNIIVLNRSMNWMFEKGAH